MGLLVEEVRLQRVDYFEAANRHWHDAEILYSAQNRREANADQLYGLAAECALKSVLVWCGVSTKDGEVTDSEDRKHIDELWARYPLALTGRAGARYPLPAGTPFQDWHVRQRYAAHVDAPSGQVVDDHRVAAKSLMHLAQNAFLDFKGGML